ncbi:hypothetical protein TNCV_836051 [Trichonephila clavipes]|nr:hypothetical protein TNCV_836051 [Trichonephila clavipes]
MLLVTENYMGLFKVALETVTDESTLSRTRRIEPRLGYAVSAPLGQQERTLSCPLRTSTGRNHKVLSQDMLSATRPIHRHGRCSSRLSRPLAYQCGSVRFNWRMKLLMSSCNCGINQRE